MALTACPDCKRQVSDVAPTCLGCGRPLLAAPPVVVRRRGARFEAIGAVLLIGGLLVAIFGDGVWGGGAMGVGFVVFVVGRFL